MLVRRPVEVPGPKASRSQADWLVVVRVEADPEDGPFGIEVMGRRPVVAPTHGCLLPDREHEPDLKSEFLLGGVTVASREARQVKLVKVAMHALRAYGL